MGKKELINLYKPLAKINYFKGINGNWKILNPYADNFERFEFFVRKYYDDDKNRDIVLALNPGRFGCGKTGIALTDENILNMKFGFPNKIENPNKEKTATRIYSIIDDAFSGDFSRFFSMVFMSNIFPFGVVDKNGNNVVFDDLIKIKSIREFSLEFVKNTLELFKPEKVFCVGLRGYNFVLKNFPGLKIQYLHHPARVFPEDKKEIYRKIISEYNL